MSNILTQNNIRYAVDNFKNETYGILYTKSGSELDFSSVSGIDSININYSAPGSSKIFIAFCLDNVWGKLNAQGQFQPLSEINSNGIAEYDFYSDDTQSPLSDDLPDFDLMRLANSPEDFNNNAVSFNIFTGLKIGLAVALYTQDSINAVPKIKLSFNVHYGTQTLTYSEYSPVFSFDEPAVINKIDFERNVILGGSAELYARAEKSDGSIIEFTDANNLKGETLTAIQYRADYRVSGTEGSHAGINYVNTVYSSGGAITSGVTNGEIISITQNWYMNISQVRMTVKHAPLINSRVKAYCAFRNEPIKITGEILGTGTGGRIILNLAHSQGLKYDTVKLFYDNQRVYSDFELNSQIGRISCNAPEGAIISCDYEYNWEAENWQEMTLSSRYDMDELEISEFRLITELNNKSVCAVKILLEMTDGSITNETIGYGAGISKSYKLSHKVKDGVIKIYSNGSLLNAKNWYLTEDTQYVRIAANSGTKLTASYDWISETPEIYQFAAVFSE